MSLNAISDSSYLDLSNVGDKIPPINLTEQIPNVNLTKDSVTEIKSNDKQGEKEKTLLSNPQKQIQSELSKANSQLRFKGTRCELEIHEDIHQVGIKVFDKETNKVLYQIPSEETVELMQKLWELAGLVYDKKG